ncbi:hypothetical protein PVAND_010878 [Polypedilum vanderplanki]|uniref:Chitin-binding type-2 domain-containing protein n=1 Tax=Polypedilum vanderplanki TaxID=319348 RepID=A0A9J6CGW1_POLVA|nr:hypothetical protein PVAND_010878 [Polypedilum vanderplanki]
MKKFSLLIVLFAVGLKITLAQNGYNYDRPDVNLATGGARPPTASGFPSAGSQGGYPAAATTPTYNAPSFPPNQASSPGAGYNYPSQSDTDFPTGGAPAVANGATTGNYPQAGQPQRPSSAYGPPQQGAATFGSTAPGSFGAQPSGAGAFGGQGQRPGATGSFGQGPQTGSAGFAQSPAGSGTGFGGSSSSSSSSQQDESQEGDYSAIPGEPEIDYPIYSEIPETSFDCSQQEYPGYYADVEARCQVFHICALNKTFDFLCPNGTIFSQETLVCVWWNQFDCNSAPGLFANNANLYDNNSQNGQGQEGQSFGAQGGQGAAQGGVANDFGAGNTGPYPAAGRPQAPTSFGSTGPSGPYPAAGVTASGNYPSGPSSPGAASYQPPQQQPSGPASYPSTPYPSAGAGAASYQPPQSDTGYPAAGVPQGTPGVPNRDYLPPRRG